MQPVEPAGAGSGVERELKKALGGVQRHKGGAAREKEEEEEDGLPPCAYEATAPHGNASDDDEDVPPCAYESESAAR